MRAEFSIIAGLRADFSSPGYFYSITRAYPSNLFMTFDNFGLSTSIKLFNRFSFSIVRSFPRTTSAKLSYLLLSWMSHS
jgi:hypothetical protein